MSKLLFDIEANELLWRVSKIWCVATQDIDTGEKNFYPPNALDEAIVALQAAECLVGHNIIGYDLPAIWKIMGKWTEFPLILDTLIVSRGLFPERYGGHSLEAWGDRLGYPKVKFDKEQFKIGYTEEMGIYCQGDIEVNVRVFQELDKEMEKQYGNTLSGYKVYT